jgi:RHS repeat-associated protein
MVKGVVNGVKTYYPGRHYNEVVDGSTSTVKKFYTMGSTTVAVRTVSGTEDVLNWVLGDHLGSTSVTANADGSWNSEIKYTAFGEVRAISGLTPTEYRYTGQLEQNSLGLYFYVARWYDPALAHFVQADAIVPGVGNTKAYDRYAYVKNNPIKYTDPSGHADWAGPNTGGPTPDRFWEMVEAKREVEERFSNGNPFIPEPGANTDSDLDYSYNVDRFLNPVTIGPSPSPSFYWNNSSGNPSGRDKNFTVDWANVDWFDFVVDIAGIGADVTLILAPEGPGEIAEVVGTGLEIVGLIKFAYDVIREGDLSGVKQLNIDQISRLLDDNPMLGPKTFRIVPVIGIIGNLISLQDNLNIKITD